MLCTGRTLPVHLLCFNKCHADGAKKYSSSTLVHVYSLWAHASSDFQNTHLSTIPKPLKHSNRHVTTAVVSFVTRFLNLTASSVNILSVIRNDALSYRDYMVSVTDEHMKTEQWYDNNRKKQKYRKRTCPSATLSTTNPTWIGLGFNSGIREDRPATKRLRHGTTPRNLGHNFGTLQVSLHVSIHTDHHQGTIRLFHIYYTIHTIL